MKGIAHFVAGVAAASCFPEAVRAGAEGNPLYFILGGVFGLLPDTLDFKFTRYFYPHDIIVTPDPNRPDARAIADQVAAAVNRAHTSGEPARIKLNTVRVGMDRWQQYTVRFDVARRCIVASYGPIVDTGQNVLETPARPRAKAEAPVEADVKIEYLADTPVDIFDGPTFNMVKGADGRVVPHFIPWHRAWSHSLPVGLLFGLVGAAFWGWWAAAVIFAASAMHAVFDQLGHMGSALFYPFDGRRISGLRLMHSGEALANFTAVWLCCLLILWNVSRAAEANTLGLRPLLVYGVALPGLLIGIHRFLRHRRATRQI